MKSRLECATPDLSLLTYNIACLPSIPPVQINGHFLRPNQERAEKITETLIQWQQKKPAEFGAPPQIVCFQEAFADDIRKLLIEKLSSEYPYNTNTLGTHPFSGGSGLLIFSQYEIVEQYFHHFTNLMVGPESLAYKGFISTKMKWDQTYFSVYNFHLGTPGILPEEQAKIAGTASQRRGEEMGNIHYHMQTRRHKAPANTTLTYAKTFALGDFNTTLNNSRQMLSISTGLSNNDFEAGQVKYPGQYSLFNEVLEHNVPINFQETRVLPNERGQQKPVIPELEEKARAENSFTGSTYPEALLVDNLKNGTVLTRQTTECKIIDGLFASRDGIEGTLETQVISLEEIYHHMNPDKPYRYAFSDHLSRLGIFKSAAQHQAQTPCPERTNQSCSLL